MRLLIVRLSAMGDIIHALPLAANACAAGAQVGWLTETVYVPLLEGNPAVARVFAADTKGWRRGFAAASMVRDLGAIRGALRSFAPDLVLDVQGLWKSSLLARLAGAPVAGFSAAVRREPASALLCHLRLQPGLEARHVVERNLALLEAVGVPVGERAPDARYLLARPSPAAESFLAQIPRPFAVYHPGAGRPEKAWGEERYAALARLLLRERSLYPVVSWGPGDAPRVRRLEELVPQAARAPELDYAGLACLAAASSLFVAGDTGPLHLADALGVATLGLFGPTDPARNGPYRTRERSVRYDPGTPVELVVARALEIIDEERQPA